MKDRLSIDSYLWRLAFEVAKRSTCDRFMAGCVVAKDGILVATGYNGSVDGEPHCDEAGHKLIDVREVLPGGVMSPPNEHCIRTIHAEVNAIINACKTGGCLQHCDWYINGISCQSCANIIARLEPRRIFMCVDTYKGIDNENVLEFWKRRFGPSSGYSLVLRTREKLRQEGIID